MPIFPTFLPHTCLSSLPHATLLASVSCCNDNLPLFLHLPPACIPCCMTVYLPSFLHASLPALVPAHPPPCLISLLIYLYFTEVYLVMLSGYKASNSKMNNELTGKDMKRSSQVLILGAN
jgi:hypothetical protein